MSPEVQKMRRWLHGLLDVPSSGTVVDLGCGTGDDLRLLAESAPNATFIGLDRSQEWIRKAEKAKNVEFRRADLTRRLPFADQSVDAVYSVNLLECIPDKAAFVRECARILRPHGRIVVGHFDWETQTFDGEDRAAVRRIVQAYNEWQQAWMETIDPWTGRRLRRHFAGEESLLGEIHAYTLISTDFEPNSYGRRQADSFEALVRREMVSQAEYDAFMSFQREQAERGTFLYTVTMFAFAGRKA